MSDTWIEWNGGECPIVAEGIIIECTFRDGATSKQTNAERFAWMHTGCYADLVKYRVVMDIHENETLPELDRRIDKLKARLALAEMKAAQMRGEISDFADAVYGGGIGSVFGIERRRGESDEVLAERIATVRAAVIGELNEDQS